MGFLAAIAIGALVGWLASIIGRKGEPSRPLLSIITGIIGAFLGAFILGPLLGGGNLLEATFDPRTLMVTLLGAVALLAGIQMLRGRRPA